MSMSLRHGRSDDSIDRVLTSSHPSSKDRLTQLNYKNLGIAVIFTNIGFFLFGYDVGISAWLVITLVNYGKAIGAETYYRILVRSPLLLGLIMSSVLIGTLIFFTGLVFTGDRILSKRSEIVFSSMLYFVGSLLVSFSGMLTWDNSFPLLVMLIGRFLYGGAVALSLHSIPQYISEIAPDRFRGRIGSSIEQMFVIGVLIGMTLCAVLPNEHNYSWIVVYRIAALLALIMGLFCVTLPESPRWLVYYNYSELDILIALQYIYPKATEFDVQHLMDAIEEEKRDEIITEERIYKYKIYLESNWCIKSFFCCFLPHRLCMKMNPAIYLMLFHQTYRRCFILQLIYTFFRVGCGHLIILHYSSFILTNLTNSHIQGHGLAILFIIFRLFISFFMIAFADYFGRRIFTFISISGLILSYFLGIIGLINHFQRVVIVGIILNGISFQIGYGSLNYFFLNEIVPFSIRSTATAISSIFFSLLASIAFFVFPILYDRFGLLNIFILFFVLNVFSFFVLYIYLPETLGVHLDDSYRLVDEKFNQAPSWKTCFTTTVAEANRSRLFEDSNLRNQEAERTGLLSSTDYLHHHSQQQQQQRQQQHSQYATDSVTL